MATTDTHHPNLTPTNGGIHVVQAWTYADSTARLAATGFTAADVGKVAEQQSDDTWWLLSSHSPITWKEITGGGGGEANTASNVGTAGVGVYKQKTGVDLEFKKINAGSNKVTITDDTGNDEVDIDVAPANIKLDDLGAPDDNTDLDATTSAHGLLPKLGGGTTNFLRADGTWAAPPGSPSASSATATADTTITSTSPTVINSMTLTPGAGTYLAMFSASAKTQAGGDTVEYSIYGNGSIVTHTERKMKGDDPNGMHTQAVVTVSAGQAIDVRAWNTAAGKTTTIYERSLILVEVA